MNKKRNYKKGLRQVPKYIPLVIWLGFTIAMIGWIFMASLSTTSEIYSDSILSSGFHLENYINVMKKHKLGIYFMNSLIYCIVGCVGIVLISAPAAYALSRIKFKGKHIVNNIFVIGMSIPQVMLVMPLFKMATSMNLIGSRWTLMILYIAVNVPFGVFFLSGFFISLPKALEEAAEIDGCTPSEAFWKIMFPLAQPGIMTLTIFNFINIWNEYFMALIFANKTELRTVSTGLQAIVQSMKYSGDWAGLFAGVIIVFLPTFLLYIFLSNKIIAGVTGGAVKG
ncbi:carbohydrate ABC transporter permease [Blautia liquoris]|uniref:Carbohydrate ABC transporter permease n=1 Tax=Blautia liquoris TaxID=2779518 RepID=A0A7M2RG90_9FIRM|nr:carbohydrate ABC transporter permease [Blautia liquoris]QOV19158.1 carbohydrate ABC transporter permease [Blautia liquoris]